MEQRKEFYFYLGPALDMHAIDNVDIDRIDQSAKECQMCACHFVPFSLFLSMPLPLPTSECGWRIEEESARKYHRNTLDGINLNISAAFLLRVSCCASFFFFEARPFLASSIRWSLWLYEDMENINELLT